MSIQRKENCGVGGGVYRNGSGCVSGYIGDKVRGMFVWCVSYFMLGGVSSIVLLLRLAFSWLCDRGSLSWDIICCGVGGRSLVRLWWGGCSLLLLSISYWVKEEEEEKSCSLMGLKHCHFPGQRHNKYELCFWVQEFRVLIWFCRIWTHNLDWISTSAPATTEYVFSDNLLQ